MISRDQAIEICYEIINEFAHLNMTSEAELKAAKLVDQMIQKNYDMNNREQFVWDATRFSDVLVSLAIPSGKNITGRVVEVKRTPPPSHTPTREQRVDMTLALFEKISPSNPYIDPEKEKQASKHLKECGVISPKQHTLNLIQLRCKADAEEDRKLGIKTQP